MRTYIEGETLVTSNALPISIFEEISSILTDWDRTPYFFTSYVSSFGIGQVSKYNNIADYQWGHLLVMDYEQVSYLAPRIEEVLLGLLKTFIPYAEVSMLRVKANVLNPQVSGCEVQMPHVDHVEEGMYTGLLYLNDSDGDTIMYDKAASPHGHPTKMDIESLKESGRITPTKNTLVLFPSNRFHSSSTPSNVEGQFRLTLNFIFKIKEGIT